MYTNVTNFHYNELEYISQQASLTPIPPLFTLCASSSGSKGIFTIQHIKIK